MLGWTKARATVLIFGPPGGGKSHLGHTIGHVLTNADYRVLFTRTSEIVQNCRPRARACNCLQPLPSSIALTSSSLVCDQTIELTAFYSQRGYRERLRRIRYKNPDSGKTLVFLINDFGICAMD